MPKRLRFNPWLAVGAIVAIALVVGFAGLSPYISTKAKPVPNKLKPGDSYPVTYITSATIPSVRIDLCSDSTNTPCIPMAGSATGTQTLIVIPGTFATGQAHINVTNRDTKGQLTSTIQKTMFITIVAPDGSSKASTGSGGGLLGGGGGTTTSSGSSGSGSTSGLGNIFNSTGGSAQTPLPTTNQSCPVTSCPGYPARQLQTQDCNGVQKNVTMLCAWVPSINKCDWQYPACPVGGFLPSSTPVPEQPEIYSVLIYYQFTINGQPHIVADVDWRQPNGTRLVFRPLNTTAWQEPMENYLGHARLDLTAAGLKQNETFALQIQSSANQTSLVSMLVNIGSQPPDDNQRYVFGGNGGNSPVVHTNTIKDCQPADCGPQSAQLTEAMPYQICPDSSRPSVICGYMVNEGRCNWGFSACLSKTTAPARTSWDIANTLHFDFLYFDYSNFPNITIDITWTGPAGSSLYFAPANGVTPTLDSLNWQLATPTAIGSRISTNVSPLKASDTYEFRIYVKDAKGNIISPPYGYSITDWRIQNPLMHIFIQRGQNY